MNRTKIEYLDYTWNPIAMRCDPVNAGCLSCWHRRMAKRLANNPMIPEEQRKAYAGGQPVLINSRLNDPLKVKTPARIGVQFMGDLWHKNIDWPMMDQAVEVCQKAPQHTFIFLTKRIEGALYYFNSPIPNDPVYPIKNYLFRNIWLGVSVENQKTADERIPILLKIPAAVRWVSVEPCLEYVDLAVTTYWDDPSAGIHWVIVGCETGPKARPCPEGAIENLYEQCRDAGIPFFDKRKDFIAREFPKS